MIRKNCLVCGSEELSKIINLGSQPFADTFIPESKIDEGDVLFQLVCDLCNGCGQIQTKYKTDPLLRYSQIDYSYTSANSNFSRTHWENYAKEISKELELKESSFIIEVGSNDGYLSEQFQKKGNKSLGVDPSQCMANLAEKRNVKTIVGLFGKDIADKIVRDYGNADLVIANNVFNHSDNPLGFAKSVAESLNSEGSFSFEQPYWIDSLKSRKFDQIYHEHVSYFTVKSLKKLLERAGFLIKSVKVVDYHGGSLRIIAQKKEFLGLESSDVEKMIKEEESAGAFKTETYKKFMKEHIENRNKFLQKIYKIKEEGHSIIAVGAAAKGNTFLNFYNLDNSVIDYVTDVSPLKTGKYTPATRIPIVEDDIFSKYGKVYALILSWNISTQLKKILKRFNEKIEFLTP